ncbi:hypothetical protein [Polyangium mundeleinium]|uniref:Uncharacterized protein n=1 Tax=Polyangium mundeleinium TaxID=2995306 RepID=A0ABT5EGT4_9BACT|nr:hypothetical protein [Polyangium mundeleinium]MDC0741031.1 hypothetical protein [Polyangium mundeleinium]
MQPPNVRGLEVFMKKVSLALVVLAALGSSRPGCGPYKPERDRDEETKPHKIPETCIKLDMDCSYSCFRREASYSCAVCCNDNSILCGNNEKYDFASCERIDPAPAPAPDAGPSDAGPSSTPGKGLRP